jgi:hypothetical protein
MAYLNKIGGLIYTKLQLDSHGTPHVRSNARFYQVPFQHLETGTYLHCCGHLQKFGKTATDPVEYTIEQDH